MFVSSHLMSEMALTADHLIVMGRGRLIADTSDCRSSWSRLPAISSRALAASGCASRHVLAGPDVTVVAREPGLIEVQGLTAAADRRDGRAARDRDPRADTAAGIARGGVHGPHARRRRVQDADAPAELHVA